MFKIQKHVHIPPTVRDLSNLKRRYPYHQMEIGDFFFVPHKTKNTLSSHASTIGHRMGRKFVTRLTHARGNAKGKWELCKPTDKGAVSGIGVWREQ